MTASCIYEGTVRHRRFAVRRHEFEHRLALAYLDLDELPGLLGGRLLRRRPGTLRFRRRDYLGDRGQTLSASVRDTVEAHTGVRPTGPIRVLAHVRSFGHCFNPVTFYYCFDRRGGVQAVVAEVTNTPWGERHAYVLVGGGPGLISAEFEKRLHVSPFMEMDHTYTARLTVPGPTLSVHIENRRAEALQFDATLGLRRVELTRRTAAAMAVRYAAVSLRVLALIYLHGVRLKLQGVPSHAHPDRVST